MIVTASPETTVEPFARRLGAEALLGTPLTFDAEGRVTGAFDGAKVNLPLLSFVNGKPFGKPVPINGGPPRQITKRTSYVIAPDGKTLTALPSWTRSKVNALSEQIAAMTADIDAAVAQAASVVPLPQAACVVGLSGTVTTVAALAHDLPEYDAAAIHGLVVTTADVDAVARRELQVLPKALGPRIGGEVQKGMRKCPTRQ